jgi:ParB/RepB/Spo0J family partition protein
METKLAATLNQTPTPPTIWVPPNKIAESKTNPRKTFNAEAQAELTASVKMHGVLQSLLVRPLAEDRQAPTSNLRAAWPEYELVAGARRLRAARAAALPLVPVMVRPMSDQEVLELQVIENLQRQDLGPLEEAEGYAALVKSGRTVAQIVERVGKGRSRVFDYLRLLKLDPASRTALEKGEVSVSVAVLLAQVPDLKARAALLQYARPDADGEQPGFRDVRAEMERTCMRSLAGVPFTLERVWDAEHPSCVTCPHRSGNMEGRDPNTKPNLCLMPSCLEWKMKQAAAEALRSAEAQEDVEVVKGKEAKDLFWSGGSVRSAQHVDLEEGADRYATKDGPTWKAILKKQGLEVPKIVAVDGEGKVRQLATRASLRALVKSGKLKATREVEAALGIPSAAVAKDQADYRRQSEKNKLVQEYLTMAMVQAAEESWTQPERLAGVLRLIALSAVSWWSTTATRRGWDEKNIEASIMMAKPAQVLGALVEEMVREPEHETALLKLCGRVPSSVRANAVKAAEGILAAKEKPVEKPAAAVKETKKPARAAQAPAKTQKGKR